MTLRSRVVLMPGNVLRRATIDKTRAVKRFSVIYQFAGRCALQVPKNAPERIIPRVRRDGVVGYK